MAEQSESGLMPNGPSSFIEGEIPNDGRDALEVIDKALGQSIRSHLDNKGGSEDSVAICGEPVSISEVCGLDPEYLERCSKSPGAAMETYDQLAGVFMDLIDVNGLNGKQRSDAHYVVSSLLSKLILSSFQTGCVWGALDSSQMNGMASVLRFAKTAGPSIRKAFEATEAARRGGKAAAARFKGHKAVVANLVADAFNRDSRPLKDDVVSAAMDLFKELQLEPPSWEAVSKWATAEAKVQGFAFKAGRPKKPASS